MDRTHETEGAGNRPKIEPQQPIIRKDKAKTNNRNRPMNRTTTPTDVNSDRMQ